MNWTASLSVEDLSIDTIRTLSMDGVQKANSGHPGTPMALAPLTYVLWAEAMSYDPASPDWPDRDRFVLSAGHASMLIYSMLHLSGYEVSLDDLRNFRQWGSPTAGHPERGALPGIEVTTGPLGQGISNAVGLAVAEQMLAHRFNQPGHEIVDHYTYVICSDGDLMEGVSYEASSLAGHLGLGKLICFYDDNEISIAGSTDLTFTENVQARFDACGWQTLRVEDINDLGALRSALAEAKANTTQPTMILTRSVIGFGSPQKAGTAAAHGEPLGKEEIEATKRVYGWPEDSSFLVPEPVRTHFREKVEERTVSHDKWRSAWEAFEKTHPDLAREFLRVQAGKLPDDWEKALHEHDYPKKDEATRSSSGALIQTLAAAIPELVGGSADLDPSTKTFIKSSPNFSVKERGGRNIQYGIREHAMGAICNGIRAHGGVRPFCATFFVFSDYMRPTIRLASLSHLNSIFVFTHDSVGLGEDGPTHQPIEHLASLRAIPGVCVMRPADARETAECWHSALAEEKRPSVLVLSRQNLPQLDRTEGGAGAKEGAVRGGYVLVESEGARVTLIATGSEVGVALAARDALESQGRKARVVSLPCWRTFEDQDESYQASVLGRAELRVSIEAGATMGWRRFIGDDGVAIGIDHFGASAPGPTNMEKFGFSADNVVKQVKERLQ